MPNYLLCCDWGTSLFRLQLIDADNYQCLGEHVVQEGIAGTFAAWQTTGEPNGIAIDSFFRQLLSRHIDTLSRQMSIRLTGVPIVISGMASSSIGMAEVPYAPLPFAIDGRQAGSLPIDAHPDFPHDMLLISGVSSGQDVMRGEETQLIGLMALFQQAGYRAEKAIFIFPGTHAKHLYVQDGRLINFATYMTGEVFHLMATQSILKSSIDLNSLTDFSDHNVRAFRLGVRQATSSSLLHGLFTIRTNSLFDKLTKGENAFYLSGLLIGSELHHLLKEEGWPLILCSGSKLAPFYQLAIDALNLSDHTTSKPAELIDRAASVGQVILYRNWAANEPNVSPGRP